MTPVSSPFDWKEYLTLATYLSAKSGEASHRSSMSRAYDSVVYAAREHVLRGGHKVKTHHDVWQAYTKDANRICRQLGNLGFRMKLVRENADYKSHFPRQAEQMKKQLTEAVRLLQLLTNLPQSLPSPY